MSSSEQHWAISFDNGRKEVMRQCTIHNLGSRCISLSGDHERPGVMDMDTHDVCRQKQIDEQDVGDSQQRRMVSSRKRQNGWVDDGLADNLMGPNWSPRSANVALMSVKSISHNNGVVGSPWVVFELADWP